METLQAVLFDYGHTLLDFTLAEDRLLACYEEVRRMLEAQALRDVPEAAVLVREVSRQAAARSQESYDKGELQELDIVRLFEQALSGLGLHLEDAFVRQIVETEHRALATALRMPEENLEVLRSLREAGLKIGIVSNATFLAEMMREDFERLGISPLIHASVISSEAGVRKPHPAIFRRALGLLDVDPARALFVGDRLREDVGGPQAIGMRAVLTRQYRQETPGPGTPQPDFVVERLPELVPYALAGERGAAVMPGS
jgi:HAD superfamily hydrolase (TIGR01549 family)